MGSSAHVAFVPLDNTPMADALSGFVPARTFDASCAISESTPANSAGEGETVLDAVAFAAQDNVVDPTPPKATDTANLASSGDVAVSSQQEQTKRIQKTHSGKAPLRPAPIAPPLVKPKPAEARIQERNATQNSEPLNEEWVELEHFLKFSNIDFVSLVRVVKARGFRPMLCIEVDVPNAYTRVELSLAVVPGDRVEMTVRSGEGFFAGLLAHRKFFRDEVFGENTPNPPRVHTTRGMRALLEIKCSLIDAEASR